MKRIKISVLALALAMVLVGMSFAAVPIGANGATVLAPTVTKDLSEEDIYFGTGTKETTVTIEVAGEGGVTSTSTPMDVVFAIDSSGSMDWNDGDDARLAAASDFVDQMNDAIDQGGVVSWDTAIDFTYGLSSDFVTLNSEIANVDHSGGTNLNVGLDAAIDMLDANTRVGNSVEVIIFLTDGQGSYTYAGSGGPASEAATSGYIIYSIGLTITAGSYAEDNLVDMATATGGAYFSSPSPANLAAIYGTIFDEIVSSTVPWYVDVTEVLQDYIILNEASFNIAPDSITENLDGTTTLFWGNIGMYDDSDPDFSADEVVTLTFDIRSAIYGDDLEVQVEGEAIVEYYDEDINYVGYEDIPQALITVHPYETDLIAGGGNAASAIDVGGLTLWYDDDYLYVVYTTVDGWYMTETHLSVEDDFVDIPQTKKGNPIPGKFQYSADHDPAVQEVTYTIPWTWDAGTTLSIAAHASVMKLVGYDAFGDPMYQTETAWGDGEDFEGRNWATWFEFEDP